MTNQWTVSDRNGHEIHLIMRTNTTLVWLFTHTEQLSTGQEVEIEYDREGDTLEILFTKGSGRGVALSEEIILRYDIQTNQPLSLIFIGFSHFMEQTPYGPESYRLTGLERLPNQEREQVLQILTSSPVDRYLHLSALALSAKQPDLAPIAYIRQPRLEAA